MTITDIKRQLGVEVLDFELSLNADGTPSTSMCTVTNQETQWVQCWLNNKLTNERVRIACALPVGNVLGTSKHLALKDPEIKVGPKGEYKNIIIFEYRPKEVLFSV